MQRYGFLVKGMLLSKALACMKCFLYKHKMAILSYRRIPLAILLCEQFIHLTQITLRPNKQLLSSLQNANQSFLSYFLVLFGLQYCYTLGELKRKHLHEHELQLSYYNMGKYGCPNIQNSGTNIFFPIFVYKLCMVKIQNCKYYQKYIYLGQNTFPYCSQTIVAHVHLNALL